MNWAQVNRIAWKDMRRMGPLWLCLVGFWLLCGAISAWQWSGGNFASPFPRQEFIVLIVPFMAIVHAIAWAGVAFASEHDDNTYGFLRALPVDAKHVFYGKMFYGVNSTLLLALVLALMCVGCRWFLIGRGIDVESIAALRMSGLSQLGWIIAASVPLTLATGVFWSLKCRSLWALVLGSITSICVVFFVCFVVGYSGGNVNIAEQYKEVVAICAGIGAFSIAFLVADRRVVESWMPNRSESPMMQHAAVAAPAIPSTKLGGGFWRLMWMQLKHGHLRTLLIGLAGIWLAMIGMSATGPLPVLAIGLLGVFVFRSEHESKRFRFLSQVGVRPFSYWFSRVLLPIGVACVIAWFVAGEAKALWSYRQPQGDPYLTALLSVGCMATFCIAQFVSIAFPSTIVGIAVTLACSMAAWVWLYACIFFDTLVYQSGVAQSDVVVPIPFLVSAVLMICLPLLASYLRVSRWFQETGSWRQWVIPALPVVGLIIGMPVGIALWRVYSIPSAELPAAFAAFDATVVETDGTRAYREVFVDLPSSPPATFSMEDNMKDTSLLGWKGAHPKIVKRVTSAIEKGGPIPEENRMQLYGDNSRDDGIAHVMMSATCLLLAAKDSESIDNYESAWTYYRSALQMARHLNDGKSNYGTQHHAFQIEYAVYRRLVNWAMVSGNTAESVEAAAIYINEYHKGDPPPENALLAFYQQLNTALDDGVSLPDIDGHDQAQRAAMVSAVMPWEAIRSRRFFNYAFAKEYVRSKGVVEPQALQSLTAEKRLARSTLNGEYVAFAGSHAIYKYQNSSRRGVVAQLALIAHKLKFGTYPNSFSAVRLAGRELSDEFADFQFIQLIHATTHPAPCVLTGDATVLVPDSSEWTETQFEERQGIKIANPNSQRGYDIRAYEGFGSRLGGTGDEVLALSEILRASNGVAESGQDAIDRLTAEIETKLDSGTDEQKLLLMDAIREQERISMFIDELLEILDGDNVELSVKAASVLEEAFRFGGGFGSGKERVQNLAQLAPALVERASKPAIPRTEADYRLPIRNPRNGNYYETVVLRMAGELSDPGVDDSDVLENWKCIRTFRGVEGTFVKKDTEEEGFLNKAFPGTLEDLRGAPGSYGVDRDDDMYDEYLLDETVLVEYVFDDEKDAE